MCDIIRYMKTHNKTGTVLYKKWAGMKRRCLNQNEQNYKNYGGRGIGVCDKWLNFEGFYEDMKDGFVEGLSIERINNDGDYCKENCRWIPMSEQVKNKRGVHIIEYLGDKDTILGWSKRLKLCYEVTRKKISNDGKTLEQCVKEAYKEIKGYTKKNNLFVANIFLDKKRLILGYYKTKEEAHDTYKKGIALKKEGYSREEIKNKLYPLMKKIKKVPTNKIELSDEQLIKELETRGYRIIN